MGRMDRLRGKPAIDERRNERRDENTKITDCALLCVKPVPRSAAKNVLSTGEVTSSVNIIYTHVLVSVQVNFTQVVQ